jgi:uncharacterized protein with von Willebrand factor type A (vWA) domain
MINKGETMTNPNAVQIVFVIDESGSMGHLRGDVIGGFNTLIAEQRKIEGAADVTLYTFSNRVHLTLDAVALADVQDLTEASYQPGGMTAMNDAIGTALSKVLKEAPDKAIINIFTDGHENASVEYSGAKIKELVKQAEEKGYQIVFLAANIDEVVTGAAYGISAGATRSFVADAVGMEWAMLNASACTKSYRSQ